MATPADPREALRRLQAREDYIGMGHKRSVDALFKSYVQRGRECPDEAGEIPTRSRTQIYRWSDEDEWERHAQEALVGSIEQQRKQREEKRERGYHKLSLLSDKAIETLSKFMDGGDRQALLAAIETLDRAGVVRQDKIKAGDVAPQTASAPAHTASDEEILRYFSEKARGTTNG